MIFNEFKKTSKRHNVFSSIDILGSFDFMTLGISLDALTKDDFENVSKVLSSDKYREELLNNALDGSTYEVLKKFYGLAHHEHTHFIDTTSTVWGIQYINKMNEAYLTNPDIFSATEADYYKAKRFFDLTKSLKLPKYYTTINPKANQTRPWPARITFGYRFDSKGYSTDIPIPFVSFYDSENQRIARSPLSTVALLEASAMAQEFFYNASLVNVLQEESRLVETSLLEKRGLDEIYNPYLTEYTVCALLIAGKNNVTDVLIAFAICERITTLALNFTNTEFEKISLTPEARETLYIDSHERVRKVFHDAMRHRCRGYIFYLISSLMPKSSYSNYQDIVDGISHALRQIGLDYDKILTNAEQEIESLTNHLSTSQIKSIALLSSSFLGNFHGKVHSRDGQYNFASFNLPPVLLGDSSIVQPVPSSNNALKDYDFEISYNELVQGQLWVERFSEACL